MQLLFRPQSLYFLLAALCAAAMFLFPINSYEQTRPDSLQLFEHRVPGFVSGEGIAVVDVEPLIPIRIIVPVLIGIMLISIFLFGNRKRQMTVARSSYFISLFVIAGAYMANSAFVGYLSKNAVVSSSFGVSFYLPFAVIAFTWLGIRSVKKDEDLVSSLDRLR